MANRAPTHPSDGGGDPGDLAHDDRAFAEHVVRVISRRMSEGSMTADDWSVEGPEMDPATGVSITRYFAAVGPYTIRLDRTKAKISGMWLHRLAVVDDAIGLGFAGSDNDTSAVAQLIDAVDRAVASRKVASRGAVLRLLAD